MNENLEGVAFGPTCIRQVDLHGYGKDNRGQHGANQTGSKYNHSICLCPLSSRNADFSIQCSKVSMAISSGRRCRVSRPECPIHPVTTFLLDVD
jgi:hypothetical protein